MPKKQGIYAKQPSVSKKKISDTNPVGTVGLGAEPSRLTPQRQPSIHGLDVPAHTFRTPSIKGSHGYGHVAKMKQGNHRMSGVPKAHRIGSK